MSRSVLEHSNRGQCGAVIDVKGNVGCHIYVVCTRPHGHPKSGHEFVGTIGGEHLHIVWGEPDGGDSTDA